MKEITLNSRRRRFNVPHTTVKSSGQKINVQYACPKGDNDLKRFGRELSIVGDNFSIKLDGRGINAIKSVLERAGELS